MRGTVQGVSVSLCTALYGGVGPLQVLGDAPHLLYQATHEGRALLLGGSPPLPFLMGCPTNLLPLLHAVHWERTLLGGCLALLCPGLLPPPPLPSHA